jgi:hypothetical protein
MRYRYEYDHYRPPVRRPLLPIVIIALAVWGLLVVVYQMARLVISLVK